MSQIQARDQLRRRGLIARGDLNELRLRLLEDDAFGGIEGNLANSSDQQLRETCKRRGIPSRGKREELIETIDSYNQRKRSDQSENEDEGPLNIGMIGWAHRLQIRFWAPRSPRYTMAPITSILETMRTRTTPRRALGPSSTGCFFKVQRRLILQVFENETNTAARRRTALTSHLEEFSTNMMRLGE